VDNCTILGDVYHSHDAFLTHSLVTRRGTRSFIAFRLRARHQGTFSCAVETVKETSLTLMVRPRFTPDWVRGEMAPVNRWFSMDVRNAHPRHWARRVAVHRDPEALTPPIAIVPDLAPNQVLHFGFQLNASSPLCGGVADGTASVSLYVSALYPPEQHSVVRVILQMRCRDATQSLLFTYLDRDGSVQRAGIVRPLLPPLRNEQRRPRQPAQNPILVSLHGTGVRFVDNLLSGFCLS
jgi:hypothetical protein